MAFNKFGNWYQSSFLWINFIKGILAWTSNYFTLMEFLDYTIYRFWRISYALDLSNNKSLTSYVEKFYMMLKVYSFRILRFATIFLKLVFNLKINKNDLTNRN